MKGVYKIMDYKRPTLIHQDGNPDETAPGFNFTRNDFEDLIDYFTPFEDIPILLGVKHAELDEFCKFIYNMNYKDTYDNLLRRSNLYFRRSMISLSKSGNPTAIKVAAEYYVGLGAVDKQENKITFIGVMPEVESDVERLRREQERQQEAVKKAEEGIGR